jgi:hypothetical protein
MSLRTLAFLMTVSAMPGCFFPSGPPAPTSKFPILYGSPDRGTEFASPGLATDSSGNVYLAGNTNGNFTGFTNQGGESDLLVMKVDTDGVLQWTQQLGTAGSDGPCGLGLDGSGHVYVAGTTTRSFPGFTVSGGSDVYVVKLDSSGARQWIQQLGTASGDGADAVAVDASGNVYVAGTTSGSFPGSTNAGWTDPFVMKIGSDGTPQWVRQWGGVTNDFVNGVAVDGEGNVYAVGELGYPAGGYVAKFDSAGTQLFVKPLGTRNTAVATGGNGEVYLVDRGQREARVVRLDGDGTEQWARPLDAAATLAGGVTLDTGGNLYVMGQTYSSFPGFSNEGGPDIFLIKLDNTGAHQWVQQMGGTFTEVPGGLDADGEDNLFVSSSRLGSNQGGLDVDVVLMKLSSSGVMY